MKMNNKLFAIFLCVIMMFSLLPVKLFAAGSLDTSRSVSLSVIYTNGETPIRKALFRIYRFATLQTNGDCLLTADFSDSGIAIVEGKNDAAWMEVATALHGYVDLYDIEPTASGKTEDSGIVEFHGMEQGLYLVVGDSVKQGSRKYTAEPFVISLPGKNVTTGAWSYDVTVSPKYTSKKIEDNENTITRKVIKVWKDEGFEFKRPESIRVVLLKDGEPYETVLLNASNNWRYEWTRLNENYTWTIAEDKVPDGYSMKTNKTGITYTITNIYKKGTSGPVERLVKKIWNDWGNENYRPESIEVVLYQNGTPYDTAVLNEANRWQHRWKNLPSEFTWTADEAIVPPQYEKLVSNGATVTTITNTRIPDAPILPEDPKDPKDPKPPKDPQTPTDPELPEEPEMPQDPELPELPEEPEEPVVPVQTEQWVIKSWDDIGFEACRPASVEVVLYKNGEAYDTIVLSDENEWQHRWTDSDAEAIWSVKEKEVPAGYHSSVISDANAHVITNTYVPPAEEPQKETCSVVKIWKDTAHESERPDSVEMELLCDGVVIDTVKLDEACDWKHEWTELDGGYVYTVREKTVLEKYATAVQKDGNLFVVTNTYSVIPQTGQLWWPVPMLLAAGLFMILLGMLRRRGMGYEK